MSTQALTADASVLAAVTYVSSSQNFITSINLPEVLDGSGVTVAVDHTKRIEATGTGAIKVLDSYGRLIGTVPAKGQAVVVAQAASGATNGKDQWSFSVLVQTSNANSAVVAQTSTAVVTTGVTQTTPFGFAGAAQGDAISTKLNLCIAEITALVTLTTALRLTLVSSGLMKAE